MGLICSLSRAGYGMLMEGLVDALIRGARFEKEVGKWKGSGLGPRAGVYRFRVGEFENCDLGRRERWIVRISVDGVESMAVRGMAEQFSGIVRKLLGGVI